MKRLMAALGAIALVAVVGASPAEARTYRGSIVVQSGWVLSSIGSGDSDSDLTLNDLCQKGEIHDPRNALENGRNPLDLVGDSRVIYRDTYRLLNKGRQVKEGVFFVGVALGDPLTVTHDGTQYTFRRCYLLGRAPVPWNARKLTLEIDGQRVGAVTGKEYDKGLYFTYDANGRLQRATPTAQEVKSFQGLGYHGA